MREAAARVLQEIKSYQRSGLETIQREVDRLRQQRWRVVATHSLAVFSSKRQHVLLQLFCFIPKYYFCQLLERDLKNSNVIFI